MAETPFGSDPESYGAKLREKGVQVSPAGMVKHNGKPPAKHRYNQWEKGIAQEARPGGTYMPRLTAEGDVIPIKDYSTGKFDKLEANLARNRAQNTTR